MYVSIDFYAARDCYESNGSIFNPNESKCIKARLSDKYFNDFMAAYTNNGDWIFSGTKPCVILTEKINFLIYHNMKNNYICPICPDYLLNKIKLYNITKFLLLKQIVNIYLITDLLKYIVDLSD